MSYEHAQRRRLAVALALTVVLVPAAFLFSRGDDGAADAPSSITLVGGQQTTESDAREADVVAPDPTDVMGTAPVDALHSDLPVKADDGATIAIPRMPRSVSGVATFRRSITSASHCLVSAPEVTFGARVTVTNLDNDQSVDCINDVGGARPDELVVLHPDAFLVIADLTDTPVPVQITW